MIIPTLIPERTAKRRPSPDHWANRGCQMWQVALQGLTGGTQWYDIFGLWPWSLTKLSGTDSRQSGPWSPASGSNTGTVGAAAARPGALANSWMGPFVYGSGPTRWYGTSNAAIGSLTSGAGTIAFWLRPAGSSTVCYQWGQGTSFGSGTGGVFRFLDVAGSYQFQSVATTGATFNYNAIWSYGTWDTTKWYHLCGTWSSGGVLNFYVNGISQATSGTISGSLPMPDGTMFLSTTPGATDRNNGQFYNIHGMDDFNIWNYKFSDADVLNLYWQSGMGWPGRLITTPMCRPRRPIPAYVNPFSYYQSQIEE